MRTWQLGVYKALRVGIIHAVLTPRQRYFASLVPLSVSHHVENASQIYVSSSRELFEIRLAFRAQKIVIPAS
jgi:hypothetical protein